jgi:hypothetical protein
LAAGTKKSSASHCGSAASRRRASVIRIPTTTNGSATASIAL